MNERRKYKQMKLWSEEEPNDVEQEDFK